MEQRPLSYAFRTIASCLAYADSFAVRLSCRHCARVSDVDWSALGFALGDDTPLDAVKRRARCSGCGGRGAELHVTPKTQEYGG